MRLWHQKLIPKLPRQQILGLHREICALRGNSWGKKHSTVDYVFKYPQECLIAFHMLVIHEMKDRGYNVDSNWLNPRYRGKRCKPHNYDDLSDVLGNLLVGSARYEDKMLYQEHNDAYYQECIENLKCKGVNI